MQLILSQHALIGKPIPTDQILDSTNGFVKLSAIAKGTLVLIAVPRIIPANEIPPPGWRATPGTCGSEALALEFNARLPDFALAGAVPCILTSSQIDECHRFRAAHSLTMHCISDHGGAIRGAMGLATIPYENRQYLHKKIIIAREGRVWCLITDIELHDPAAHFALEMVRAR